MAQIRHTVRARRDLMDVWLELAAANPAAAEKVYRRLEARVEILKRLAEAGPLRPAIAPDAGGLVEPPYLILYRIIPDGVQIVRVLHGARNIDGALFLEGIE
ncbi:MAG TPA: type II toxin-antitoxin system RelE/ParE family toxin [Candidatus Binataceae bacterium]|nr:type II toxin-antitoxin system RelE/ParE family toxin [Candidatus Binataceae bacterium]